MTFPLFPNRPFTQGFDFGYEWLDLNPDPVVAPIPEFSGDTGVVQAPGKRIKHPNRRIQVK